MDDELILTCECGEEPVFVHELDGGLRVACPHCQWIRVVAHPSELANLQDAGIYTWRDLRALAIDHWNELIAGAPEVDMAFRDTFTEDPGDPGFYSDEPESEILLCVW